MSSTVSTGAGGGSGAGGTGAGGNPGLDCSLLLVHTPTGSMISDFETNAFTMEVSPGGAWFASNDGLGGIETPNPALLPVPTSDITPARGPSTKGIHTTGVGFAITGPGHWGGGIGANLVAGGNPSDPVDLTAYRGISFYAKGTGTVHVQAQVPEVTGWCNSCGSVGQECFNEHSHNVVLTPDWQQYVITWDQFVQENWGYRTSLNGGQRIQAIRFLSPGPVDWDFWIDDVTLAQ